MVDNLLLLLLLLLLCLAAVSEEALGCEGISPKESLLFASPLPSCIQSGF